MNIAARLERLADKGGICVSGTVRDQLRDKLKVGYRDLGEQSVKNIPEPVRVYRVEFQTAPEVPTAAPKRRGLPERWSRPTATAPATRDLMADSRK